MFALILAFISRVLLILLFFPFSALDKVVNFKAALAQAGQHTRSRALATVLVAAGFGVEVFMSLGVLTGVADSACAVVLGFYCVVTALLWKQFWLRPDFRLIGVSRGREELWDFLKNLAVAGGFFALALGPTAATVNAFLAAPFASHDLYGLSNWALR